MTRVIYQTASSLDGFLADESDSLEWLFAVPGSAEAEEGVGVFLDTVGALVMGSTTYEWVLAHDFRDHPERWREAYGERPCHVATSRLSEGIPGADIQFFAGPVADAWSGIARSAGGRDVWVVGGGDLAGQFADAGLLDEIRVSFAPVTLGAGRPLLPRRFESDLLHLETFGRTGQFAEAVYRVGRRA